MGLRRTAVRHAQLWPERRLARSGDLPRTGRGHQERADISGHPARSRSRAHRRNNLSKGSIMEFPFEVVESMYAFKANDVVGKIAPRPLLLLHSANDSVTPTEAAMRVSATSPNAPFMVAAICSANGCSRPPVRPSLATRPGERATPPPHCSPARPSILASTPLPISEDHAPFANASSKMLPSRYRLD